MELARSVTDSRYHQIVQKHGTYFFAYTGVKAKDGAKAKQTIALAIEHAEKAGHDVVVSFERPYLHKASGSMKATRVFGSFKNAEALAAAGATKDARFYEILPPELHRHFYADLEWQRGEGAEHQVVLDRFVGFVVAFVKERCGDEVGTTVQVSTASGESAWRGGGFKCSFHVRFDFGFESQIMSKWFATALSQAILDSGDSLLTFEYEGKPDSIFDVAPYGSNQALRILYSSKFKANEAPRPLIPHAGSSPDISDHLVGIYNKHSMVPLLNCSCLAPEGVKRKLSKSTRAGIVAVRDDGDGDVEAGHNRLPVDLLQQMVGGLGSDRAGLRPKWLAGIAAIFNETCWGDADLIEQGRGIAHIFSALHASYDKDATDVLWNSLSPRLEGACGRTIAAWLREDNPALHKALRVKILWALGGCAPGLRKLRKANYADFEMPTVVYNQRYSMPIDLTDDDILLKEEPTNTGKTFAAKNLLMTGKYERVLILSARQAYSSFIVADLNAAVSAEGESSLFVDYKDAACRDLSRFPRISVQMESLHRVRGGRYDLVIIDESESCLKTLSSSETMAKLKAVVEAIDEVITNTPKLLFLDAYMTDRTLQFVQCLRGDRVVRANINEYVHPDRVAVPILHGSTTKAKAIFLQHMFTLISQGKRVALFTSSKSFGEVVKDHFKMAFGNLKMMFYSSDTSDRVFKRHLENVNEAWKTLVLLIFSPKILAGVSFNVPDHFSHLFVYGYSGSCCVRDVHQAMVRVRKFAEPEMYFLLNTSAPRPPSNLLTLEGTKAHENSVPGIMAAYYNENNMKLKSAQDRLVRSAMDPSIPVEEAVAEVQKVRDMILKETPMPDWLFDVHVYNQLEDSISTAMYSELFYDFLKDTGYALGEPITTFPRGGRAFPGISARGLDCDGELGGRSDSDEASEEVDHDTTKCADTQVVDDEYHDDSDDVPVNYAALPVVHETEAKAIRMWVNGGDATLLQKRTLERYVFDHTYLGGDDQVRARVFDAVHKDSELGRILKNVHAELHMRTDVEIQEGLIDAGNLMMLKKQATVVDMIRKLCRLLGLKATTDMDTWVPEDRFESAEVQKVAEELLSLAKVRCRTTSNDWKRVKAIVSRCMMWFSRSTFGAGERQRVGDEKRIHRYRLENTSEFWEDLVVLTNF